MGEIATVACQPYMEDGEEMRASRNFDTNQLQKKGKLKWHIISAVGDENIHFDVKQIDSKKGYPVRFQKIVNGTVTPYEAYRNLYVSNPQNATGYFIVRVEACEE